MRERMASRYPRTRTRRESIQGTSRGLTRDDADRNREIRRSDGFANGWIVPPVEERIT